MKKFLAFSFLSLLISTCFASSSFQVCPKGSFHFQTTWMDSFTDTNAPTFHGFAIKFLKDGKVDSTTFIEKSSSYFQTAYIAKDQSISVHHFFSYGQLSRHAQTMDIYDNNDTLLGSVNGQWTISEDAPSGSIAQFEIVNSYGDVLGNCYVTDQAREACILNSKKEKIATLDKHLVSTYYDVKYHWNVSLDDNCTIPQDIILHLSSYIAEMYAATYY